MVEVFPKRVNSLCTCKVRLTFVTFYKEHHPPTKKINLNSIDLTKSSLNSQIFSSVPVTYKKELAEGEEAPVVKKRKIPDEAI